MTTDAGNASAGLDAYPLTPMQQGMVFQTLKATEPDLYIQQYAARLAGRLDPAAFRAAFEQVVARHGPLRTAFAWSGLPEPLQVVVPHVKLPLREVDGTGWPDPEAAVAALAAEDRGAGLDLGKAPLFRLVVVRLAPDDHRLIWTWHHAILDAWSGPLVLDEVFTVYDALVRGAEPDLHPVRPFRDFIAWQRQIDVEDAEYHWRSALSGVEAPTALPMAPPLPGAAKDGAYGLEFLEWPESEIAAARAAAAAAGVTLNTLVQGAWALLLARYADAQDVVWGTAVAGRPSALPGVERMVGLFINTLPLRATLAPGDTLHGWLRDLQARLVAARRHEHTPLSRIQGWSPLRDGEALFESLLVFEEFAAHKGVVQGGDLRLQDGALVERADFPLTLLVAVRDQSVIGVGFDAARFDLAAMRRCLSHMRRMIAAMAAAGDVALEALDPLDADERIRVTDRWSRAPAPLPARCLRDDLSLPGLLAQQAARTPGLSAAVFLGPEGEETLDYAALDRRVDAFAGHLAKQGASPGCRVALAMEPSMERLVSLLAVLRCGAAYVPLDPVLPPTMMAELAADCRPALILADPALADVFAALDTQVLTDLAGGAPAPGNEIDPADPAYLIYTSGSTGRRKGVVVSHRSVRHLVEAQLDAFSIDEGSKVLQFAAFGFDASVSEIFTALLSGACLYMAPRQHLLPSAEMIAMLERWCIDTVTLPPSVLHRLPADRLPGLKTVVTAGEPCPADLVGRWAPGRRFVNAYGPTEATVCATAGRLFPDDPGPPGIGHPVGDVRVYLLDCRGRPVPEGVAGEIHIGGPQVAQGYFDRPELTAERFLPDPFEPGGRLYRTGDLARHRPDGSLSFLGRVDDQVKVRGIRVEPGEIEAALRAEPGVRDAAVLGLPGTGGTELVAAVVPEPAGGDGLEWWPSISEFLVYDDLAYHAMTSDERRNASYRAAIADHVKGKVVLEVGTGPEALLSRFCIEAGAKKVYAVELLDETFAKARARIDTLGLGDRIELIQGDATSVSLPEAPEVCVSEIVGAIGGSEGAAMIMNAVREQLAPGAAMIPARSLTLFAPVELPERLRSRLGFGPLAAHYVQRIFEEFGRPFDLRLCARGLGYGDLLAEPAPFEDLDYRGPADPNYDLPPARFEISRQGRFDGFLVWLTLDCGGGEMLDILRHEHCWLPVFLPIGRDGLGVATGETIEARVSARLSGDGLHSDYRVLGALTGAGGRHAPFEHLAPHHPPGFRAAPFHADFFAGADIPRLPAAPSVLTQADLQAALKRRLPDYMVPSEILCIDRMPLSASGKVDRNALAARLQAGAQEATGGGPPAPVAGLAAAIAGIWQTVLKLERVDPARSFFDQGGHSLLLLDLQERLKTQLGETVEITDLFKFPTVTALAAMLEARAAPPAASDQSTAPAAPSVRAAQRRKAMERGAGRRAGGRA